MFRKFCTALLFAALITPAHAQTAGVDYPCNGSTDVPAPVLCYGTVLLNSAFTGTALTVQHQTSTGSTTIGFSGNDLDTTALDNFKGLDNYIRVVGWGNQQSAASFDAVAANVISTTGNIANGAFLITNLGSTTGIEVGMSVIGVPWVDGTRVTAVDSVARTVTVFNAAEQDVTTGSFNFTLADTPRIYSSTYSIGGKRVLSNQGGSHSGRVFGLETTGIGALGITGNQYTIFMVLRPTSSIYRNQQFTPGLGNGTYISLETIAPFESSANTAVGNATISGISAVASVVPGMTITGTAFPNGGIVQSVDAGTATAIISTVAVATDIAGTYTFSFKTAQAYANGQDNPGAFSLTDGNTFNFFPTDSMIEIDPVVMAITSNNTGVKIYQNEDPRTTPFRSALAGTNTRMYTGRTGGGLPGAFSESGDFWTTALIVYNYGMNELQRAKVSAQLYQRFSISYQRSTMFKKRLIGYGDSIPAGYDADALYGMFSRLADQFPNVSFGNYSVPGSTVTSIVGTPAYGYNVGMFPISVAAASTFSRIGNYLVLLGGGNDMVNTFPQTTVTISGPATPSVIHYPSHGAIPGQRIRLTATIQLPSPFAESTIYYVKTVIGPDDFSLTNVPGGTAINTTDAGLGQFSAFLYTKTAPQIMAGIQSVVDQFIAAGPTAAPRAAFVGTILPRQGQEYNFILNDVNTLIRAGGSGNYGIIDFYTDSCLATIPGPCYADFGGHPSNLGHQKASDVMQPIVNNVLQ